MIKNKVNKLISENINKHNLRIFNYEVINTQDIISKPRPSFLNSLMGKTIDFNINLKNFCF